ncbi:CDP-glycerol glycerophosphotransferase family protein [Exiguobacterium flavidum]|uniref:CDP-glycerol glycerophosphotransferase family protein n=1 Tax=Exiguobacterium flavidum TaxID=2184695 RepID=UPI000DF85A39|nr:CDP-glycerol glycerophosphotransferase family protein [Exiguobacterium flavidum]
MSIELIGLRMREGEVVLETTDGTALVVRDEVGRVVEGTGEGEWRGELPEGMYTIEAQGLRPANLHSVATRGDDVHFLKTVATEDGLYLRHLVTRTPHVRATAMTITEDAVGHLELRLTLDDETMKKVQGATQKGTLRIRLSDVGSGRWNQLRMINVSGDTLTFSSKAAIERFRTGNWQIHLYDARRPAVYDVVALDGFDCRAEGLGQHAGFVPYRAVSPFATIRLLEPIDWSGQCLEASWNGSYLTQRVALAPSFPLDSVLYLAWRHNRSGYEVPVEWQSDGDGLVVGVDWGAVTQWKGGAWTLFVVTAEHAGPIRDARLSSGKMAQAVANRDKEILRSFYVTRGLRDECQLQMSDNAVSGEVERVFVKPYGVNVRGWSRIKTAGELIGFEMHAKIDGEKRKIPLKGEIERRGDACRYDLSITPADLALFAQHEFRWSLRAVYQLGDLELPLPLRHTTGGTNLAQVHVYPEMIIGTEAIEPFFSGLDLWLKQSPAGKVWLRDLDTSGGERRITVSCHRLEAKGRLALIGAEDETLLALDPVESDGTDMTFVLTEATLAEHFADKPVQAKVAFVKEQGGVERFYPVFAEQADVFKPYATFMRGMIGKGHQRYSTYVVQKTGQLMFEARPLNAFERRSPRLLNRAARLCALALKPLYKKPVWLIGENLGEVAQDNGLAFFEYALGREEAKVFYVSHADNKNQANLDPYMRDVLRYDSFSHLFWYHMATKLVVAHGIRDVSPSVLHRSMRLNRKPVIYLQHGIIAMKRLFFNRNSYNGKIEKFIVSSEQERDIMVREMNFRPEQIGITGLARFDKLKDASREKRPRQIMIMPTWREWLQNDRKAFVESDFYQHYIGLLKDPRLHETLVAHDIKIKFFPHFEIQKKYMDLFEQLHPNIDIVDLSQETIGQLMAESTLLITDYSSVAFDFNYMKKPVIFYQFDLADYQSRRGAYVNLRTELFGSTAATTSELVERTIEAIENDFRYEPSDVEKSTRYYSHQDKDNAKRIYEMIMELEQSGGKKR